MYRGTGAYFTQSPPTLPMSGLGGCFDEGDIYMEPAPEPPSNYSITMSEGMGLVWIGGGFLAGMAMAPGRTKEQMVIWGLGSAIIGAFMGPIGLGLVGGMAIAMRPSNV